MGIAGGSWSAVRVRWVVVSFAGFAVLCCSVGSWVRGRNRRVGSDFGFEVEEVRERARGWSLELGAFGAGAGGRQVGSRGSVTYRINDKIWQLKRNQLLIDPQADSASSDVLL